MVHLLAPEVDSRQSRMQVVIGRAPACDVVLEHLSISRQHAELTTDLAGNLFLTDLGAGASIARTPTLTLCNHCGA